MTKEEIINALKPCKSSFFTAKWGGRNEKMAFVINGTAGAWLLGTDGSADSFVKVPLEVVNKPHTAYYYFEAGALRRPVTKAGKTHDLFLTLDGTQLKLRVPSKPALDTDISLVPFLIEAGIKPE